MQRALAKLRRDDAREQAEREKELRQFYRKLEAERLRLPKRDLSQLNFQTQHWWAEKNEFSNRGQVGQRKLSIDEEKAALIYEAMRRRPEVQKAWLDGKFGIGANGWQAFVGFVVHHLPQSWVELNQTTQCTLVRTIGSPWFVPPKGYSTFPDNSLPEKCRMAAMNVLHLPTSDDAVAARAFVKHARKFEDAGFLIVAVDNKTKQSVRYASQAMESLQRSFRKADLVEISTPHRPPDLPQSEIDALEKQRKAGTLTYDDILAVWRTHEDRRHQMEMQEIQQKLANGVTLAAINQAELAEGITRAQSGGGWQTLMSCKTGIMDKRKRKGHLIESKTFDFAKICRELESLDAGKISKSDFAQRVRLC